MNQSNPHLRDVIAERVSEEVADGWLFRQHLSRVDRSHALHTVFLNGQARWKSAFGVMLILAAGIAALGLSQNSAATVIGSMIVAPLGQPIVALGAAVAMGWAGQTSKMALIAAVGAVLVIATGFVAGTFLPDVAPNAQILARTAPDLRDLGVALLAGAAGAYAYTRDELSGVLPGVAISVALVPPLAAVGLMLEEGRWKLAAGAGTLFGANLIGIATASAVVMLITGFAPPPRLRGGLRSISGLLITAVAVVAIVIPLNLAYRSLAETANTVTGAHLAVNESTAGSGVQVQSVQVDGSTVTVTVDDATLIDAEALERAIAARLGPDRIVRVVEG